MVFELSVRFKLLKLARVLMTTFFFTRADTSSRKYTQLEGVFRKRVSCAVVCTIPARGGIQLRNDAMHTDGIKGD